MDCSGPQVLVVEDNDMVRRVLTAIVASSGLQVLAASSGAAASSLSTACDAMVVAAVIDVALPDATGMEVATRLRIRFPDVHLVFISGHIHIDGEPLVQGLGARFLRKPFGARELLAALA